MAPPTGSAAIPGPGSAEREPAEAAVRYRPLLGGGERAAPGGLRDEDGPVPAELLPEDGGGAALAGQDHRWFMTTR